MTKAQRAGRRKPEVRSAMDKNEEQILMREYQARIEKKLRDQEMAGLEYWKGQLDGIISLKPDGVASLQAHLRKLSDMMANRIRLLKRG